MTMPGDGMNIEFNYSPDTGGGSGGKVESEKKIKDMTFLEVLSLSRELQQKKDNGVILTPKEEKRLKKAITRRDNLIDEFTEKGGLTDTFETVSDFQKRYSLLEQMQDTGELKSAHIIAFTGNIQEEIANSKLVTKSEHGLYAGVNEFVLTNKLRELSEKTLKFEGRGERRLSPVKEYSDFLERMRLANEPTELIDDKNPPLFWTELSDGDRRLTKIEIEVANAVHYKRDKGFNIENAALNDELQGLTKAETRDIYNIPGVRQSMELYFKLTRGGIQLIRKDAQGNDVPYYLRESKDKTDSMRFRDYVRGEIKKYLMDEKGMGEGEADIASLRAETDGFNLLYLGNFFEASDSAYLDQPDGTKRRIATPTLNENVFVQPSLKGVMNPLDGLIGKFSKSEEEFQGHGAFGGWARTQINRALGSIGTDKFDDVVVIPYTASNAKLAERLWWTAKKDNGKVVLYAPDCYQTKLLGSVFDETLLEDPVDGVKKTLSWFLEKEEEIPWDQPDGGSMWINYKLAMMSASALWNYYSVKDAKNAINTGNFGGNIGAVGYLEPYFSDLNSQLAGIGEKTDINRKRWHVYASTGVKSEERLPKFTIPVKLSKLVLNDVVEKYFGIKPLCFAWDKVSGFYRTTALG